MIEVDGIESAIRGNSPESSYAYGIADVYIACLDAATRPVFDQATAETYFENRGKLMLNAKMILRLLNAEQGTSEATLIQSYESVLEQLDTVIESGWGPRTTEPEGYAAQLAYSDYRQRLSAYFWDAGADSERAIA